MTPLNQKQRQRLAAVRQRAIDQHRCEPKGIEEDEERRVGLRVFDDSLFLVDCLASLGGPVSEKGKAAVKKIKAEAKDVKDSDQDGVEKNHLAPVRLGVFGDHRFLLGLIDDVTQGAYKLDRSEPAPDDAPPPLNPEVGATSTEEAGVPG